LSFAALLGVVLLLKESLPAGAAERPRRSRLAALRDALGRAVLVRLLAIFFLTILAFAGMEATFALWAMAQLGWGPAQCGYLFTYVGLCSAVMQGGLIGRLTKRFGEEKLLISGLAAIAAGLLILPLSRDLPLLLLATSGLALGMGAMQPSLNSLISRRAGVGEQGEVLGVAQSVGSLSRVLGPLLAGALFAGFGRNSPYFCGMILVATAALIAWRLPPLKPVAAPSTVPGAAE
jgi:DHA1 family tetracycline resistance protein-like MFS transporter